MNKLYEAILDNPEDDTLRLVYADWLDDNQKYDEAELIRIQIQLQNLPYDGCLFNKQQELIKKTKIKHAYKGIKGYCSVDSLSDLIDQLLQFPIRGVSMHFFPFPQSPIPKRWTFVKEIDFVANSSQIHRFTNKEFKWFRNKSKLLLPYINTSEEYIGSLCRQLKLEGLTSLGFNYYLDEDENNYDSIIENSGLEVLKRDSWIPLS